MDQSYQNGGYDDIDYRADPEPPFSDNEAAWVDKSVTAKPPSLRSCQVTGNQVSHREAAGHREFAVTANPSVTAKPPAK